MVEAASTNQLGWLNSLVKQYDAHVSDAVLLAARIGDIKSLELLTPYMDELKDVKREAFEEVVLAASKSGNADVVRLLLPELGGEGLAWSVIKIAAGKGFMEILSFAADAAECGYEMSYVLLHAIHSRQSEAAIFLASRYYREWNLGEGLEKALVYGLNEVAECIYGVITREGQETSFHEFFVYLGGDGYSHALMYLYRRGHNDPKLLGLALDDAARGGQINVLRMLVNTGRITQDRIGETLWTTVRFGKGSSVEFLVNNSNISTQAMNRAFEDARKIEISKFLYTKLSNPAEFVVTAFRNAAGCGRYTLMSDKERVAIVKFLRSTGFVPDKLVCDAFTVAIEKWYTEGVVLTLCNEACISFEIAIEAFQKAVSVGKTKVMKL
ncbi:hypothetical protein AM588_10000415 [Phytophthora nicotianae]|uniref:Uncharacterized protein n=1 Tax=Phytophthora nicotianae TaxID=4792 RepID=A0A0W8CEU2_PHYNI|nr:hypothetical protein AM588_10000415 [Phytophthora nicotianae]